MATRSIFRIDPKRVKWRAKIKVPIPCCLGDLAVKNSSSRGVLIRGEFYKALPIIEPQSKIEEVDLECPSEWHLRRSLYYFKHS